MGVIAGAAAGAAAAKTGIGVGGMMAVNAGSQGINMGINK